MGYEVKVAQCNNCIVLFVLASSICVGYKPTYMSLQLEVNRTRKEKRFAGYQSIMPKFYTINRPTQRLAALQTC
jgi:hypothetical protein